MTNCTCYCRHEIVGIVVEVGTEVETFKIGDRAGVGCYVDACFDCGYCTRDMHQHCKVGARALVRCACMWPQCSCCCLLLLLLLLNSAIACCC
jgi:D-arabinose 1-dehydrogenase-like Zn-dependent alcohol dehydrogenase